MKFIVREEGDTRYLFPDGTVDMIGFVRSQGPLLMAYYDPEGDEPPRLVNPEALNLDDAVEAIARAAGCTEYTYEIEGDEPDPEQQAEDEKQIHAALVEAGRMGASVAELIQATEHRLTAEQVVDIALRLGAVAGKSWTGWGLTKGRHTIKYALIQEDTE
ncbi:hypothetical protein ACWCWQ_01845 [Streptomyces sp. NPDC001571]